MEVKDLDISMLKITIDKVLQEKNITREQLCKDMHISLKTLEKYCNGNIQFIDVMFIKKVCYYLECEVGDILTYEK